MITNIHLHPAQQARLKEIDLQQLEKDVLFRFPYRKPSASHILF